jgi:hypothetical protein
MYGLAQNGPIGRRAPRKRGARVGNSNALAGISSQGVGFLKCAFAAPDFDVSGAAGVPDMYAGRSLTKLHCYTQNRTFNNGRDTYIIVPPAPGVAYWSQVVPNNTPASGAWTASNFADTSTLFNDDGSGFSQGSTLNFNRFRHISLCAEIKPTVNEMTWTGTITAVRNPMSFSGFASAGVDLTEFPVITGIDSVQSSFGAGLASATNIYSSGFNDGVYTCSLNRNSTFEFKSLLNSQNNTTTRTDVQNNASVVIGPMYGMDDLDSLVIVVSIPEGANDMTGIIKIWACVEYTPSPNSSLYEFSRLSAPHDQRALEIYKYVCSQLPVAVSYRENSVFWNRILQIMLRASGGLSYVPGPVGMVSTGVNSLLKAIESITI